MLLRELDIDQLLVGVFECVGHGEQADSIIVLGTCFVVELLQ